MNAREREKTFAKDCVAPTFRSAAALPYFAAHFPATRPPVLFAIPGKQVICAKMYLFLSSNHTAKIGKKKRIKRAIHSFPLSPRSLRFTLK